MEEQQRKKSKKLPWVILAIVIGLAFLAGWYTVTNYILHSLTSKTTVEENNNDLEEHRKQEVLAYLEERYGEEFEITSYRGKSYAYDYVKMYARPKSHLDEEHEFQIQGRNNDNKEMEYTDTYVMVKLGDEYAACVDEIIDEYFDDYKFYLEFSSEWVTSNLPADAKVEDLFELRANVDYPIPFLDIFLQPSQRGNFTNENIKAMGEKLQKWGFRGEINLFSALDDAYYEKKNNENKRQCRDGEEFHREYHRIFIRDKDTMDYR